MNKKRKKAIKRTKAALARALGKSRSTLYDWEASGAPLHLGKAAVEAWAKKNSRAGHDTSATGKVRLEILRENARRLKLANDKSGDKMILKSEASFAIHKAMSLLFSHLDRLANIDWPANLKGMAEAQICTQVKSDIEKLKEDFRNGLTKMMEGETKP